MATGISRTQLVLLRGSLRLLVLCGPLYVVVAVLNAWDSGSLTWDAELNRSRQLGGLVPLAPDASAIWEGQVQLVLDDPSAWLWLLALAPTVIVALSLSVVGFQLLGILHETYAGQPFLDSSARRLRMVSRVIAVAAVTAPILWSVANVEIAEEAVPSLDVPGHVDLSQMMTWLLVALVVRVIAEAFRIGTELRRDTEGLV
jgi:hypothetical protein